MKSAAEFAHLELDGYRNINSIAKVTGRLHSSETLFGDLNAKVMVLGQDGAPFEKLRVLVEDKGEGADGYRHGPKVRTNINLIACLSEYIAQQSGIRGPINSKSCGVYYANAVWLLKETTGMAGALPQIKKALKISEEVFQATIEGLPKLELIIALGKPAYQSLRLQSPSLSKNWRHIVDSRTVSEAELFGRRVKVATVLHPSPLSGGKDVPKLKADFEVILREVNLVAGS